MSQEPAGSPEGWKCVGRYGLISRQRAGLQSAPVKGLPSSLYLTGELLDESPLGRDRDNLQSLVATSYLEFLLPG